MEIAARSLMFTFDFNCSKFWLRDLKGPTNPITLTLMDFDRKSVFPQWQMLGVKPGDHFYLEWMLKSKRLMRRG